MAEPGPSSADSPGICKLCNTQAQRYMCPKCEIPYCSLECYKSEAHAECSESFYKEWVETELRSQEEDPESRRKMMEILQRLHNSEAEFGEDLLEDDEDGDVDVDPSIFMDSDDDDDIPDLAKRLETVDFNNPDELWAALTDAEKQEFEVSVRNGDAEKFVPVWSPWWSMNSETVLIQEVEDNEDVIPDYVKRCPNIIDVPTFNELVKASPCVRFNLINVLHAYAYMALHFNGDHRNSPKDSVIIFLKLSENMRNNKIFEDSSSAIESVAQKAIDCQSLPGDEQAMAAAKEAVNLIINGPDKSNPSFYVTSALSDLHQLFTSAKKNASSSREASSDRTFAKKFHINETGTDISNKTLMLCTKKIEYYLSWVKSYGMKVDE